MRRKLILLVSSSALTFSACNCGKPQVLLETSGILAVTPAAVEFGLVTEFTQQTRQVSLENTGRGALTLSVALEAGSSAEFSIGPAPVELAPGAKVNVEISFAALGPGEDTGAMIITSDEANRGPVRVPIHAGAIYPVLRFDVDPLAFAPVSGPLVEKQAVLRNVGQATLHVNAIGVNALGNPDFSITPPLLPLSLAPDASVPVSVSYARSLNPAEGLMEVVSDEPEDGGNHGLRLLPDPSRVCGDGMDNDNDGLTDFPDDIGCTSTEDGDEYNAPECVTGGVQPCGNTTGSCRAGSRRCANSIWGACDGGVRPMSETCNGQDDDCNGMSDENLSELCTINSCSGARACVPNSGTDAGLFTACIPVSSMPEICNGLDDNCNGATDEGVVQTCTVFGCAGVRICVPGSDGGFTSCMPTNPLPESCNGMDDDCNGAVDDVPDLVCGLGPCRRVAQACIDGGVSACLPGNPGTEFCNGIDDDCNGTIDDGVAPLTCGAGACANTVPACMLDGGANMCVPAPPSVEICNNIDDNCNGTRDEKADGGALTQTCYTGPGPTRNIGRCIDGSQSCTTGAWGSCLGEVVPGTESCNTFDDNCNGRIDEQADGGALQQACYTGSGTTRNVGRCRDGAQSCVSGSFGACSGDVLPGTETCNNVDDNCNGATDESLTQACYTGPAPTRLVGRCRDGTQTCAAGSFGACNGQVLPNASEICGNSIDDNCAGGVDEGCSGCNPSGAYTLDAGVINYACCGGSVTLDISQFQISPTSVFPGPTQPGTSLAIVGAGPTCPSGAFTYRVVLGTPSAFTCVETYTLTGNFVGPNTFVGTYTASFAGAACSNSLCLAFGGPACTNQSWNVSAGR